jgi:hypothetical protein
VVQGRISADDLAPAELRAFESALASGEAAAGVEPWHPWWLSEEAAQLELSAGGTALVEPVGGAAAGEAARGAVPPPPAAPLPRLAALTSRPPSPALPLHFLDLIYAYCLVLRLFNGDYGADVAEAAAVAASVSSVLGARAPGGEDGPATGGPDSVDGALLECVVRACAPAGAAPHAPRAFAAAVLHDVAAVLQLGRPTAVTALGDLSRLAAGGAEELRGSSAGGGQGRQGGGGAARALRRRLELAARKLLFFSVWANEQPGAAFDALALQAARAAAAHAPAGQST